MSSPKRRSKYKSGKYTKYANSGRREKNKKRRIEKEKKRITRLRERVKKGGVK